MTGGDLRIQRITRPELDDLVCEALKDAIFSGQLRPGSKVSEESLARSLGVSRTPVKTALVRLSKEGFVELIPRRGAFVRKYHSSDLREILEVRRALDVLAAGLAATHITADGIAVLETLLDEQEESCNELEQRIGKAMLERESMSEVIFPRKDLEFHVQICRYTGNTFLANLVEGQFSALFLCFFPDDIFLGMQPVEHLDAFRTSLKQHRDIAEALRRGEKENAEELAFAHLTHTIDSRAPSSQPGAVGE